MRPVSKKIERVMTILVLRNLNSKNFEILKSQLIFEISLQIFACDHNFYRFQNNFLLHRVSLGSFVDFQGLALSTPLGFIAISDVSSEGVKTTA